MTENDVRTKILECAFKVHNKLGAGLLEIIYEITLCYELKKCGFNVKRQVSIPVFYDDLKFDEGFKADVLVNNLVLLELKSVEKVHPVHKKQLLTYLKLTNPKLGYLLNFNVALMKQGITRIVNNL